MEDGKNKMLKVLYEDNHIIVVEKPVNIPSQADKTGDEDMLSIIKGYLKEKYHKPGDVYLGLVHRLDRPTRSELWFLLELQKLQVDLVSKFATNRYIKNI